MNIDRRHLVLPALAVGLVGVAPALATSADEGAVAKSVEAFRLAQIAADAKAFDALCAAELSYSHSDGRVEDKATFIANATNGKSKFLSLEYLDPQIRVVPLGGRKPVPRRWQEKQYQSPYPDELAETGCGLEASVPRVNQALIARIRI
jgi:uncharacterized protein DUF4440